MRYVGQAEAHRDPRVGGEPDPGVVRLGRLRLALLQLLPQFGIEELDMSLGRVLAADHAVLLQRGAPRPRKRPRLTSVAHVEREREQRGADGQLEQQQRQQAVVDVAGNARGAHRTGLEASSATTTHN